MVYARTPQTARSTTASEAEPELRALIDRLRSGDPNAMKGLLACAYPLTSRFVFRLTGPSADFEDLVHASLEQIGRSAASFAGRSRATTFVFGVCHHVVARHRRAERIRRLFRSRAVGQDFFPATEAPDGSSQLERSEALEEARQVLARLGTEERTVFVLHELENLPLSEVALALGSSIRTVKRRLHSVRARFTEMRS